MIDSPREDMGKRKNLRLSDMELEYLKNGDTGSYSTGEIDGRITETRDKLPKRLKILFDDVAKLSEGEYLSADEWMEAWLELMDKEGDISKRQSESIFDWGSIENPPVTPPGGYSLGYDLGEMVSRLMLYNKERSKTNADILLGFLHGLYGARDSEESLKTVKRIIPHLEERAEESVEWRESIDMAEDIVQYKREELAARVLKRLIDRDLVELTKADSSEESQNEPEEETEPSLPSGISIVMEALDDEFGAEWYVSELENDRKWKDTQEIREVDNRFAGLNIETEEIERVIEERNLEQEIEFWQQVDRDRSIVRENKWSDVSPSDILRCLYNKHGDMEPSAESTSKASDINRSIRSGDRKGNLTVTKKKILPELAGQRDNKNWSERPLIEETEGGWSLTEYGELISYIIFDKEPWAKFYHVPRRQELVEMAKKEVGSK
jgi:hypothetical protein